MMNPTQTDKAAALRRAIIRVWPDYYYSWPEARQERHRLQRSREDDFRIRQAVVQSLFGLDVRSEEELSTLLEEAHAVLERERIIRLSRRDAQAFFRALENPPSPYARLKKAVAAYKRSALNAQAGS
jgi:uncharacterized protein (DUF1778 family)